MGVAPCSSPQLGFVHAAPRTAAAFARQPEEAYGCAYAATGIRVPHVRMSLALTCPFTIHIIGYLSIM